MISDKSSSFYKTKEVEMALKLHPAQYEINNSPARFNVAMCGGRFGKTVLALWKLIERAGMGHTPNWYIAPTYRQAKSIAWLKLLSMLPRGTILKKNETELYVELRNHARIELKGADNEDTLRGVPLASVVFDETPFIRRHVWEEIVMPRTVDYVAPVWFIGTPSLGKDWFYKLYLKGQEPGQKEWKSFHYTILDNPYLNKEEVNKLRLGMNPALWRQECLAEPTGISGLVYPTFEHSFHVVKPFTIPPEWKKARSLDWGMANPTCCLWSAENPESRDIYIYREHYQAGWTANKQAMAIRAASRGEVYEFSVLDPTAFRKERDGGSVADDFIRNDVRVQPGDNTKEKGFSVCNKYLSEKPCVYFFETCYNLIDEISSYIYVPVHGDANRREEPKKEKDHAMDAWRYKMMEYDRRYKNNPGKMTKEDFLRKVKEQTEATQRLSIRRRISSGVVLNNEGYINAY